MTGGSALRPIWEAVFALLSADSTLMAMVAGIFDAAPEGTAYPFVQIGEAFEVRQDTFQREGKVCILDINIWSLDSGGGAGATYAGYRQALSIGERIAFLLDDAALAVSGYDIHDVTHSETRLFREAQPDGRILRRVLQEYRVWAIRQ